MRVTVTNVTIDVNPAAMDITSDVTCVRAMATKQNIIIIENKGLARKGVPLRICLDFKFTSQITLFNKFKHVMMPTVSRSWRTLVYSMYLDLSMSLDLSTAILKSKYATRNYFWAQNGL